MNTKELILSELAQKGSFKAKEIVEKTSLSRGSVHSVLKELTSEGKIVLIGKANQAKYMKADSRSIKGQLTENTTFKRVLLNSGLEEDTIFKTIERETSILSDIPKNVKDILYYAFTEMMNNAIEHSKSEKIEVSMKKNPTQISFEIADRGVGIFNNIRARRNLNDNSTAIEILLKGRQTTDPTRHSGEGIFFTSRVADIFRIKSSSKMLTFDNSISDIFLNESRVLVGTKVDFVIDKTSTRTTSEIFNAFTDESYAFTKTQVHIDLHKGGNGCISRSQARRVVNSLDPFHEVVLDFRDVDSIGQGFADEIFRVWQNSHSEIKIEVENASDNVMFMINHVKNAQAS